MDRNRTLKIAYEMCRVISSALHKKSLSVNLEYSDELFALCCKHKVSALVSTVIDKNSDNYSEWENAFNLSVIRKTIMDSERERLFDFLKENHIWFMQLKGLVLENLYPDKYLREMCDNDILYNPEGYKLIKDYMIKNGYSIEHTSADVHVDEYEKKPYCFFEMHKKLFNINRGKIAQYYHDMDKFLIKKDEYEYKLCDEDFYVYMIAHSYKHFIDGGTGLRSFIDCYLFNKKISYDKEYVQIQLKELGIEEFEAKFSSLADKLFCDKDLSLDDEENEMLLYCVSSGAYGTKQHFIENQLEKGSKFRYIFRRVFPPLEWYKGHVPFCYKHKWSIPFYCVYRVFDRVIRRRKYIKNEIDIIINTDNK